MIQYLRKIKKRISENLLKFANKSYAKTLIFFHSIADSSFLPISIDLTLVPISIASPQKSFIFGFWATIGSILGGILSYYIGMEFMSTLGEKFVVLISNKQVWDEMVTSFRGDFAVWSLIVAAITPIPFSLACLASGVVAMDFTLFLSIAVFGRVFRFTVISVLIYFFGNAVQVFLDKYSGQLLLILFISLICVFLLWIFFKL